MAKSSKLKKTDQTGEALILNTMLGFGDCLYMTPTIKAMSKLYRGVDLWTFNTEPFLNNPHINQLFKMDGDDVVVPWDFYGDNIFYICPKRNQYISDLYLMNIHMVDFYSLSLLNIMLPPKEKELVFNWSNDALVKVCGLIEDYEKDDLVILNPAIGWPSRTLPLEYYQKLNEVIQESGNRVVLVGKDIQTSEFIESGSEENKEDLKKKETKTLYAAENFPGAINLYNQLSLEECAALYSIAKIAINTENGNMVISNTNKECWNLYIPTLTHPSFRLPYKNGSQGYMTSVLYNEDEYYPGSDYSRIRKGFSYDDMIDIEVSLPSIERICDGYRTLARVI